MPHSQVVLIAHRTPLLPSTQRATVPPDVPPDTATRGCPSKINIFPASTLGVYCWRYAEHMNGPWVCPVTNADGRLPN
jgi:hypothetical protein